MKETRQKRAFTVRFPLYKILERAKVIYGESSISVVAGSQLKGSDDCKGHKQSLVSDKMLYI